jgi:eukaryotic-like serine/threonine-protein kinase
MHAVKGAGRVVAGRYLLENPIGRGAMGIVWRGRDNLLHRDVAVKEVRVGAPALSADADPGADSGYQRTLREARAAARLSHPNVVTIFDIVEESGSPWIVMELVSGRSLDRLLAEDGPLPPRRVAELGVALLGALSAAHVSGVLHRDVKPGNVLVTTDGRPVLTDFGLAVFAEDPSQTLVGMVRGTPGFTAPERMRGHGATPASDLWSLGATLYAAVEGRGPFDRPGGPTEIATAVAREEPPPAPSAGPLAPAIEALLCRDPAARADAATAAALLADAAREQPGTAVAAGAGGGGAGGDAAVTGAEPRGRVTFLDPPVYAELSMPGPAADDGLAGDAWAGAAALAGLPEFLDLPTDETAVPAPAEAASGTASSGSAPPQVASGAGPSGSALAPAASGAGPSGSAPPQAASGAPSAGAASRGGAPTGESAAGPSPSGSWPSALDEPAAAQEPESGRRGPWARYWRLATAGAGVAAIVAAALLGSTIYSRTLTGSQDDGVGRAAAASTSSASASATRGRPGGPVAPSPAVGAPGDSTAPGIAGAPGVAPAPGPSTAPGGRKGGKTGGPTTRPGPSGGTGTPTGSSSPSPAPSDTTPAGVAPPAGFAWHTFTAASIDATAGFVIALPAGWQVTTQGQDMLADAPASGERMEVSVAPFTYPSPVREARYEQAVALAVGDYPKYRKASIGAATFQGTTGANWRFSWKPPASSRTEARSLLVTLPTTAGPQSFELSVFAPSPQFAAARAMFTTSLSTFSTLAPA